MERNSNRGLVVPKRKTRGSKPRQQKGKGRGKSLASTEAALQELASVVAVQNIAQRKMLKSMQASPLGATLFKDRSDLGDLGDGVDKSIRAIKRLMNVEVKSFDAAGAGMTPTTTGTVVDLVSAIAQGVTDNTRVGDSIKVLRLILRMTSTQNAVGGGEQYMYILVARSHDEIMTSAQLNVLDTTNYAHLGGRNWDYKDQYSDLWSRRVVLDPEHQTHFIECDLKLNSHVQYNAGGNTVNSGCLMMAVWANTTVNNPSLSYVLTVEYVDN